MMGKKSSYQIPFLQNGNMAKYGHDRDIVEWKDNFEFSTAINFDRFERGRSAAHAIFESADLSVHYRGLSSQQSYEQKVPKEGFVYQVFLTDLADMMRHMNSCSVEGIFTFCKRGRNYGVKLVKAIDA